MNETVNTPPRSWVDQAHERLTFPSLLIDPRLTKISSASIVGVPTSLVLKVYASVVLLVRLKLAMPLAHTQLKEQSVVVFGGLILCKNTGIA